MSAGPPPVLPSQLVCCRCGYNLTGATIGGACPECGTPIEESLRSHQTPRNCSTAVASMIVGICSLVVCMVLGPLAIWLYYRARREMTLAYYAPASVSMAKAGLILGIISTCILCLYALGLAAMMLLH